MFYKIMNGLVAVPLPVFTGLEDILKVANTGRLNFFVLKYFRNLNQVDLNYIIKLNDLKMF